MLYFLLIIIAVGVLLISEKGQELLGILLLISAIVGGAYLLFWAGIIAWAFITSDFVSSAANTLVVGAFRLASGLAMLFAIYYIAKLLFRTSAKMKEWFTRKFPRLVLFGHKHKKINSMILLAAFMFLVAFALALSIYYSTPQ